MRKLFPLLFVLTSLAANAATVLSFGTMYGVDGPFVNSRAIRGVLGDELPWEIKSATGSLSDSGHLQVSVKGLVFADVPSVPANLRGINDEANFRALVSCLTEGKGGIETANVLTARFPATRSGNSEINTMIRLPNPCVAPIIFIMSGEERKWFSVTGVEKK